MFRYPSESSLLEAAPPEPAPCGPDAGSVDSDDDWDSADELSDRPPTASPRLSDPAPPAGTATKPSSECGTAPLGGAERILEATIVVRILSGFRHLFSQSHFCAINKSLKVCSSEVKAFQPKIATAKVIMNDSVSDIYDLIIHL